MRVLKPGIYEIGYQPEEIPTWFQDLLDELFDGAGVPKEYMAHVREMVETIAGVLVRWK